MPKAEDSTPLYLEMVLALTVFAAGAVDIISFTRLGGIFASAMTGNLALLALYLAQSSINSAIGSIIALLGFTAGVAMGNLLTRRQSRPAGLSILLGFEAVLLSAVVPLWFLAPHANGSLVADAVIVLLALSMGLQIIAGKRIDLSNIPTIVFTSTLTNFVVGITETLAGKEPERGKDTWRQLASFMLYFSGAFLAGLLVYLNLGVFIALPAASIVLAFVIQVSSHGA